jgi:hypothetical protein
MEKMDIVEQMLGITNPLHTLDSDVQLQHIEPSTCDGFHNDNNQNDIRSRTTKFVDDVVKVVEHVQKRGYETKFAFKYPRPVEDAFAVMAELIERLTRDDDANDNCRDPSLSTFYLRNRVEIHIDQSGAYVITVNWTSQRRHIPSTKPTKTSTESTTAATTTTNKKRKGSVDAT